MPNTVFYTEKALNKFTRRKKQREGKFILLLVTVCMKQLSHIVQAFSFQMQAGFLEFSV